MKRPRRIRKRKGSDHLSISARNAEWEAVRGKADRAGLPIARYVKGLVERDLGARQGVHGAGGRRAARAAGGGAGDPRAAAGGRGPAGGRPRTGPRGAGPAGAEEGQAGEEFRCAGAAPGQPVRGVRRRGRDGLRAEVLGRWRCRTSSATGTTRGTIPSTAGRASGTEGRRRSWACGRMSARRASRRCCRAGSRGRIPVSAGCGTAGTSTGRAGTSPSRRRSRCRWRRW